MNALRKLLNIDHELNPLVGLRTELTPVVDVKVAHSPAQQPMTSQPSLVRVSPTRPYIDNVISARWKFAALPVTSLNFNWPR